MVGFAEECENFEVREAVVFEPFVEVVDVAFVGWFGAVWIDAASVAGDHGEALYWSGVASCAGEFEDFAAGVLIAVVEIGSRWVEE